MTPTQQRAYDKLKAEWLSAYQLHETRGTLNALVRRGLAEKREVGFVWRGFNERTQTEYRSSALAEAARRGIVQ